MRHQLLFAVNIVWEDALDSGESRSTSLDLQRQCANNMVDGDYENDWFF